MLKAVCDICREELPNAAVMDANGRALTVHYCGTCGPFGEDYYKQLWTILNESNVRRSEQFRNDFIRKNIRKQGPK